MLKKTKHKNTIAKYLEIWIKKKKVLQEKITLKSPHKAELIPYSMKKKAPYWLKSKETSFLWI